MSMQIICPRCWRTSRKNIVFWEGIGQVGQKYLAKDHGKKDDIWFLVGKFSATSMLTRLICMRPFNESMGGSFRSSDLQVTPSWGIPCALVEQDPYGMDYITFRVFIRHFKAPRRLKSANWASCESTDEHANIKHRNYDMKKNVRKNPESICFRLVFVDVICLFPLLFLLWKGRCTDLVHEISALRPYRWWGKLPG